MGLIFSENELHSQNPEEFEELLSEYCKLNVERFIEIGSLYGWTLQHFIQYAAQGSTALSIDLPVRQFVGPNDWRVAKQEHNYYNVWPTWAKEKRCNLNLLPYSSQDVRTVRLAKDVFKEKQVDFLFIDGDHRYEAILNDYNNYSPLVRKGGIVAFHDIAINEEGGGHRAWNVVKQYSKHREILKSPQQDKGIGIIYV